MGFLYLLFDSDNISSSSPSRPNQIFTDFCTTTSSLIRLLVDKEQPAHTTRQGYYVDRGIGKRSRTEGRQSIKVKDDNIKFPIKLANNFALKALGFCCHPSTLNPTNGRTNLLVTNSTSFAPSNAACRMGFLLFDQFENY